MIDPRDDVDVQVSKQAKIIDALITRINHQHELGGSAYSLFQSAIALQSKVSEKTRDLEDALNTLGHASYKLETSEEARAQTQRSLSDALETMDGGFALFTEGKLQVFNEFFRKLIPDIKTRIKPGLDITDYIEVVKTSTSIKSRETDDMNNLGRRVLRSNLERTAPFVFSLTNDRWFVIASRQTSSNNTVILQTEITSVVRQNRLEKTRLIDEQENFLHATFDNMPQGVGTFSAEGTLLIANSRFGDLLTLPISLSAAGTSMGQIVDYLREKALTGPFSNNRFGGLQRYLRRHRYLRLRVQQVNEQVLDIDVQPMPNGGFIVNVMDVTAEFQATEMLEARVRERTAELTTVNARLRVQHEIQASVEEDLRIAKAEVEDAMSSKTKFFAAASHDLLQPVNAAKLFISTLLEQSQGTEMHQTAGRLDSSFRSIERLLHALLDIARLESTGTQLAATTFPLDEVLRGIADDLEPLALEKGLDLRVIRSRLWVESDPLYLTRSVQNLVDNAIQYTQSGRILVGCRRKGGSVVIEVWDTGVGIPKSDQGRIFKEFTRVGNIGRSGHGMGLGLSIVDRACRHLGHKIGVRSKPGKGSVFSIELPIANPAFEDQRPGIKDIIPPASEMDLIVMLIENDPGVSFAMTQKLESWGASVLAAEGTSQALDMVSDLGMAPDIILADYQLDGDDNGIMSIKALRETLGQDVPGIMITANYDERIKQAGVANGFSVLTKPVQLSRLRSLMDWKTRRAAEQS
ncbi:MAG: PAS-domain containing protein [Paracoccaceae bacterium]